MQAGLIKKLMTIEDIVKLIDVYETDKIAALRKGKYE